MTLLSLGDGRQIHFERIAGAPRRPQLVFLHEGLGSVAQWRDFPALVCARSGCPGLVYDRTGYGGSGALPRARTIHYLHEYALEELPQVLGALLAQERYVLIGHSDGGSIALLHAAEQPAGLLGIVTAAAHVFVEAVTVAGIRAAAEAFASGRLAGLAKYHGDRTASIFDAWARTWCLPSFRAWNIEYALPSIACPVLALQGDADQYGTVRQLEAIVAGVAGPAVARTLPGCGHSPQRDDPGLVASLIADFVAELTAPA